MACETLEPARDGAVPALTVNRPEVLNARSRVMLEEFDRVRQRDAAFGDDR